MQHADTFPGQGGAATQTGAVMNRPSFTAQAALYRIARPYRGIADGLGAAAASGLTMAQVQNCGPFCYFNCGLGTLSCIISNYGGCNTGDPYTTAGCLAAKCGGQTVKDINCIAMCKPCTDCATCTNCHNTWFTCVCNGAVCGQANDGCCTPSISGPPPPPPDCTMTGCHARGTVCCDCVSPAVCATPAQCYNLCRRSL